MSPPLTNKIRYSDAELVVFDTILDEKIAKATESLDYYLKQIQDRADADDNKLKSLSDASGSAENERLQSMAARQSKLIQHLNHAKSRIKNKVYGICRESGVLISKERLKAVPHATLSIKAKQKN